MYEVKPLKCHHEHYTHDDIEVLFTSFNKILSNIEDFKKSVDNNNILTKEQTEKYNSILKDVEEINKKFNEYITGDFIPDYSITLRKLNKDVTNFLIDYVKDNLPQIGKFIAWGVNNEGRITISIPDSWNDVIFTTDEEYHLILKIKEE